jgi:hypothetical protein
MDCIINILWDMGNKIVDGYYPNLEEPSYKDIEKNLPEISECFDFIQEAKHD